MTWNPLVTPILRRNLHGAAAMALCLPLLLPPLTSCALTPGERRTLASAEPVILAAEAAACADAEMVAVPYPALEGALVVACPAFVAWTRGAIDRAVAAGVAPAVGERIVVATGARARVVAKVVPGSVRDAGAEGRR